MSKYALSEPLDSRESEARDIYFFEMSLIMLKALRVECPIETAEHEKGSLHLHGSVGAIIGDARIGKSIHVVESTICHCRTVPPQGCVLLESNIRLNCINLTSNSG